MMTDLYILDEDNVAVPMSEESFMEWGRWMEAARESVELAKRLVVVERRRFELQRASLLEVTLREQQLLDSATALIEAHRDAHIAEASYRAALAVDALPDMPPPGTPPPFCRPESHCE